MLQAEGVSGLVRSGIGDVLGVAVAQVVGENKNRVRQRIGEGVDIGHTAGQVAQPGAIAANRDQHGRAVVEVRRGDGRHVHFERSVVLRHALPDIEDRSQLVVAERGCVAVGVVDRRADVLVGTPHRVEVADEIQIDRNRGADQAIEDRHAGERVSRGAGAVAGRGRADIGRNKSLGQARIALDVLGMQGVGMHQRTHFQRLDAQPARQPQPGLHRLPAAS